MKQKPEIPPKPDFFKYKEQCVICKCKYQAKTGNVCKLTCGHEFHVECIAKHLVDDNECIICKKQIKLKEANVSYCSFPLSNLNPSLIDFIFDLLKDNQKPNNILQLVLLDEDLNNKEKCIQKLQEYSYPLDNALLLLLQNKTPLNLNIIKLIHKTPFTEEMIKLIIQNRYITEADFSSLIVDPFYVKQNNLFYLATLYSRTDLFTFLSLHPGQLNFLDDHNRNMLHILCKDYGSHCDLIESIILMNKKLINQRDTLGERPVDVCIATNNVKLFNLFLKYNTKISMISFKNARDYPEIFAQLRTYSNAKYNIITRFLNGIPSERKIKKIIKLYKIT